MEEVGKKMTATEIATQLTIALIERNSIFASGATKEPAKLVAEAYDVILTGVCKAMDNANQLKKS